ncbi:NAD-dependent epimerase/dehydratase family protein [Pedobacter ginsengisoli]|uniref:NAD-dependent epimerase/dehydratase family protein n=1 Tax=Pedobacter ginsengisoli TaxID=363852 RepID=UPI00254BB558|nr:NAD(P)-dependent oxidoreductase [Pedobacter ginsengisoli]
MNKKVLITGATGFVGYHLIEKAVGAGLDVYAAVRPNSNRSHLSEFKIRYIDLNYTAVGDLVKTLEEHQFNYIIHAAGTTKAKTSADYNKINAEYTKNLALAAVTAKISLEKFVFVSSLAALGPLIDLSERIQDDTPAHPVTNYGASKLLAERYLLEIAGLPLIIIRPTAVYGPREKDIFILFKSISRGLEPHIGSFKQHLSFVYVKDLADVIVNALFATVNGKQYNVSDGYVYNRYVLADTVKKALNKKTFKFHIPVGVVSLMASFMDLLYRYSKNTPALNKEKMAELTAVNWACNIDSAKKDLGYAPQFDLGRGIQDTIKWYKENSWL